MFCVVNVVCFVVSFLFFRSFAFVRSHTTRGPFHLSPQQRKVDQNRCQICSLLVVSMLACICPIPSLPTQPTVTDQFFLRQFCFGRMQHSQTKQNQAAGYTKNNSHSEEHTQCEMKLEHAGTLNHPAPRSLHSQKSVSRRPLPTTLKCTSIGQNTNLKHPNMFNYCFQHVLLKKEVRIGPLPW